jgi:hypothetical protein
LAWIGAEPDRDEDQRNRWITLPVTLLLVLAFYAITLSVCLDPSQPNLTRLIAAAALAGGVGWTAYVGVIVARDR